MKDSTTYKVIVKTKKELLVIGCEDIPENYFYLNNMANKTVTINSYCPEEDVFTCEEYPSHVIPFNFISKLAQADKNDLVTYEKIMSTRNDLTSVEATRQVCARALKTIQKILLYKNEENRMDFTEAIWS